MRIVQSGSELCDRTSKNIGDSGVIALPDLAAAFDNVGHDFFSWVKRLDLGHYF